MKEWIAPEAPWTNEPLDKLIQRGFIVLYSMRVNVDQVIVLVGRGKERFVTNATCNQLDYIQSVLLGGVE